MALNRGTDQFFVLIYIKFSDKQATIWFLFKKKAAEHGKIEGKKKEKTDDKFLSWATTLRSLRGALLNQR